MFFGGGGRVIGQLVPPPMAMAMPDRCPWHGLPAVRRGGHGPGLRRPRRRGRRGGDPPRAPEAPLGAVPAVVRGAERGPAAGRGPAGAPPEGRLPRAGAHWRPVRATKGGGLGCIADAPENVVVHCAHEKNWRSAAKLGRVAGVGVDPTMMGSFSERPSSKIDQKR